MVRLGRWDALGDGQLTRGEVADELSALLSRPGYAALLAAVRARLEAGGAPRTLTLQGLDPDARQALADLLSRTRLPGTTERIHIDELDAALRTSRVGAGLVEVLETTGGPLADRRSARAAARGEWAALWDRLEDHPLTAREGVRAWLDALREQGVLARLAGSDGPGEAATLAEAALEVIRRLPASGVPLAVLASEACHDPHALDPGKPAATLVLRWAAAFTSRDNVPVLARDRRQLWSDVGVTCDPLSASVLVLGLRARGHGLLATTLAAHADAGEPLRLTLRQLLGHPLASLHGRVHICENPAVVAAAANRLGAACRALVCVEGMPDTAGDRLLGMLATGAPLAFHCDFDWGGVRIGNVLATRFGATPWRYRSADYESALAAGRAGTPLAPATLEAAWDPILGSALRAAGRRVDEEAVLDRLLDDLTTG